MRSALRAVLALSLLLPLLLLQAAPVEAESGRATFIVTLRDGDPNEVAAEHARRYDADVQFVYEHALRGYAAEFSEGQISELARDRRVERTERDQVVHAWETEEVGATNQANPDSWGLDRVDDRAGLDNSYTYDATGAGVTAYIIDTGIRTTHTDFRGTAGSRAVFGANFADDNRTDDCNGHGTHVAGTVGGNEYGIAKGVKLVAVRVLDCNGSGTWAGVVAGVDWVTEQAALTPGPDVANMSLGGGASTTVDSAVSRSITEGGVSYAVAAGNGNRGGRQQDACGYSPARVPAAMTIGATTQSDAKTSWSNYGDCVDWFAPGYQITSAWIGSDTDTNTISGTSMSAPHTAGAAALYLEEFPGASTTAVHEGLSGRTTKGIVTSSSTTNNHLLYTLNGVDTGDGGTGGGGGSGDDGSTSTSVTIAVSCTKATCTFDATPAPSSWTSEHHGETKAGPAEFIFPEGVDIHTVTGAGSIDGVTWEEIVTVTCQVKGRWTHCSA